VIQPPFQELFVLYAASRISTPQNELENYVQKSYAPFSSKAA
jgi:hypothetical protein